MFDARCIERVALTLYCAVMNENENTRMRNAFRMNTNENHDFNLLKMRVKRSVRSLF